MLEIYKIDKCMRFNWECLLREMQENGADGPLALYAWWSGEQGIIQQSLQELETLQSIEETTQ